MPDTAEQSLNFPIDEVEAIIAIEEAGEATAFWGLEQGHGLAMTGDRGVHLQANRTREDDDRRVVYAVQANPDTVADFNTVKCDVWGSLDSAQFIPIEVARQWVTKNRTGNRKTVRAVFHFDKAGKPIISYR